ncbi:MAG: DEAD/DEAH box helicase [Selenomonadales bacterium]|nr:DEAD/DEAH box helicase [Selenomonadales bacterium]
MAKASPMDRLLCGDVGFGKTEVAIRAAYNAVLGGWENGRLISKQVAVLVPTTVLAQQHYKTFQERFQGTGVNIDVINRFRSAKEQRETLQRTRDGLVDILIGTHAILNQKKVQFRDLGLLIVDEEQRFGVKQKEKIKSLAAGVDCLTLSATPIPRTLHMSLTGTRDMSIIESAPADRYPVQSFVVEDDDGIIRDAIRRELKRGGQVYFVYNRVETIDYMKKRLEELVPEAVIQTAHGQMPEEMLERIMVEFYEGKYDILLATSIIENGLDIPNANTIIVHDADKFGLSQLYQMRGRVGRSSRMAYAYFVYQENKVLTETAERRLQAIKEFTELGAGFKIAMRDLEIRGAGNLLGAQQHGHIASVGFEMYCRLLEEAVQTLRTGRPPAKPLEPVIELPADAYIDGEYIEDAMHKIEVYQRMAAVRDTKQLLALEDELEDRFGVPTEPVRNLLSVMDIKNYARRLGIQLIILKNDLLELEFASENSVEPENLMNTLGVLKNSARMKKKEYTLQVKMGPKRKANLLRFVKGLVRSLAGEAGRK